ncbi:hypothetical protein ACFE04_012741 [Oxalis oulophora]
MLLGLNPSSSAHMATSSSFGNSHAHSVHLSAPNSSTEPLAAATQRRHTFHRTLTRSPQGVSRTLAENSRLPNHLHERLGLIRNAKIRLEEKGITPSIDKIAESLNMSQKKVRNAKQAVSKVYSLDRDAFPSLNGLPGETHHSYIADHHVENIPWHGIDKWALKEGRMRRQAFVTFPSVDLAQHALVRIIML